MEQGLYVSFGSLRSEVNSAGFIFNKYLCAFGLMNPR